MLNFISLKKKHSEFCRNPAFDLLRIGFPRKPQKFFVTPVQAAYICLLQFQDVQTVLQPRKLLKKLTLLQLSAYDHLETYSAHLNIQILIQLLCTATDI